MKEQLDRILEKWNLLKHPFYQAWSAGALPVEALKVYAQEYGTFIETLPKGWLTLHDEETAQEENEHAAMWRDFAEGLNTFSGVPEITETVNLMKTTEKLFADPVTALGALYAFEAQQPKTARSKLQGLRAWYNVGEKAEKYFEVHSANWHESEKLLRHISALPQEDQAKVLEACTQMSEALWNGLTGVQSETC